MKQMRGYVKNITQYEEVFSDKIQYMGQLLPTYYYLLLHLSEVEIGESDMMNIVTRYSESEHTDKINVYVNGELLDYYHHIK